VVPPSFSIKTNDTTSFLLTPRCAATYYDVQLQSSKVVIILCK